MSSTEQVSEFVELKQYIAVGLEEVGPFEPKQWFVEDTSKDAKLKIAEVSGGFRQLMEAVGIEKPKGTHVQFIFVISRQPVSRAHEALCRLSRTPYLELAHFYALLVSWKELEVRLPEESNPIYRFFVKAKDGIWEVHFERGRKGHWFIGANRQTVFPRLEPLETKDVLLCGAPPR